MTTTIEGISVRLGRDSEDFRRYVVTVQAYSLQRPGLKSTTDIDPGKANNRNHLLQLIGAAGAACAEHLDKNYGDDIDPVKSAQATIRAFGEECHLQVELMKDAPSKVKRLETHAVMLRDEERELLRLLRWSIDHGKNLTPVEVQWVDEVLGQIHGGSL